MGYARPATDLQSGAIAKRVNKSKGSMVANCRAQGSAGQCRQRQLEAVSQFGVEKRSYGSERPVARYGKTPCSTSPLSGRLTIAQQFTAGIRAKEMKSVERTAEGGCQSSTLSVVRFTDFVANASLPSDESLGYCQPSAGGLSPTRSFHKGATGRSVL